MSAVMCAALMRVSPADGHSALYDSPAVRGGSQSEAVGLALSRSRKCCRVRKPLMIVQ